MILIFQVLDQKTANELGYYDYNISQLATKTDLEVKKQPFALLRGGGDSKLIMSMRLRVIIFLIENETKLLIYILLFQIFKYEPIKTETTNNEEMLNDDGSVNGECLLQRKDSSMSIKSSKFFF